MHENGLENSGMYGCAKVNAGDNTTQPSNCLTVGRAESVNTSEISNCTDIQHRKAMRNQIQKFTKTLAAEKTKKFFGGQILAEKVRQYLFGDQS